MAGKHTVRTREVTSDAAEWRRFGLRPDDKSSRLAHDVWVEVNLGEGWIAAYRIVPSKPLGEPAVGELRIFPAEPNATPRRHAGEWSAELLGTKARCPRGGVTAKVLKSIRLGRVVPELNAVVEESVSASTSPSASVNPTGGLPSPSASPSQSRRIALERVRDAYAPFNIRPQHTATPPRRGRTGRPRVHSDAFYARVAQAYREALDRGEPKAAESVAAALGLKRADLVPMMVHRGAKARGLITSLEKTWILTEHAKDLLRDARTTDQAKTAPQARRRRKR